MANVNEMSELLMKEFAENYMEPLYYFCLKKTGSSFEAEDLTQDIALNILSAIHGGQVPESFSGWVWQIARNRYSKWAARKHRHGESVTGSDIADLEIADENDDILGDMIHAEEMNLLRRELAFISGEYRNIVTAFYLEDRSIRDIAASLSLPDSVVKQRLYRARKILKEGMNMAREFGKKSYKPEEIFFTSSGYQPSGLPWSAVQRSIPKNILLEASNNPSTLEELSVELGVALPYMEEEVEILHKATLLEKEGDKYVTNFFILDKECREAVYNALRRGSKERSRLLSEIIEDNRPAIRGLGIAANHITDNEIKWWLIPDSVDYCIKNSFADLSTYQPKTRANGENWGFVGYETWEMPEYLGMDQSGSTDKDTTYYHYCPGGYGFNRVYLDCDIARLLMEIFRYNIKASDIDKTGKCLLADHAARAMHFDEDGNAVFDILMIEKENHKKIRTMLESHKNYEALLASFIEANKSLEEIFKKYGHKTLHDTFGYYVRMEMYKIRMMCIHDLVDSGFITLPEDPAKSNIGMYLIMK